QTSWGVSTRLIGAIIMTHGDNEGLVLPPRIAPFQLVVIPVAAHKEGVKEKATELYEMIKASGVRTKIDLSEQTPGWKFAEYEMKGFPLRLEVGPRDIENGQCVLVRRDTREKIVCKFEDLTTTIPALLEDIQTALYNKALKNREEHTYTAHSLEEMKEILKTNIGFVKSMWCGDLACEEKIKEETGMPSRCMPLQQENLGDVCPVCGKPAHKMVVWGIAY
ncbi:MAG: proline--tRNA ligase, partial [Butyricicoccus sp.]|nr:proline--tRNA ligase [Butyricicoccus sp.]